MLDKDLDVLCRCSAAEADEIRYYSSRGDGVGELDICRRTGLLEMGFLNFFQSSRRYS